MTNKEAIFKLIEYCRWLERNFGKFNAEPFDKAIGALEQEPVLDKIRAEIEKLNPVDYGSMFSYESHNGAKYMKDDVLRIIDRYGKEK